MSAAFTYGDDDYVPMNHWGQDHWSTLAYMETVLVEYTAFQVGFDPRMRQNRRHFRVMNEECRSPLGRSRTAAGMGSPIGIEYKSKLADGAEVTWAHDDWSCVQDMAVAGLLQIKKDKNDPFPEPGFVDNVQPGAFLTLSEKGWTLVQ